MRFAAFALAGPYNTALTLALTVALGFSWRAGRRAGLPMSRWAVLLATALAAGYVGSRTLFLDFQPVAPGEKTNLGALLLGIPALVLTARALGLGGWRALDLVTRPTLGAMAIGRVGCFAAGCCAGTATALPWAVADRDGHLVHPVQLYEAAADAALLLLLGRTARAREGTRFLVATLGYVAIRFSTEFVRAGRERHGGLDLVQWSLLAIGVVLAGIVLARRRVTTEPRTERRAAAAPPVPTPTPAFAPAFALAFRWRAVPLALLPQVGAFFMFQAPAAEAPPRREIVAGGSYWRALYDQTLGYEYATDCEGGNNRIPTLASREAETVDGMLGYRFRTAKGDRVTIEARYQAGHDAVSAIDSGPVTTMPRDFDTWAAGGAVMLEQRDLTARLSLMSGAIGSTGRMANGIAPTMMLRFGDEARWFSELQVADRTRFGATGEFSYLGIGYTMGRDRPRAMLGLGEGGRLDVFVPMAGFETGLSYRSLSMREDGSHGGEGWRVSVQRAIRLR